MFVMKVGNTVWKFHNFSITEILREIRFWYSRSAKSAIFTYLEALKLILINFWGSRSAKSAISKHLEALNFDFCEFLHFLKAEN